jgi:hypothetical protein
MLHSSLLGKMINGDADDSTTQQLLVVVEMHCTSGRC